MDPIVAEMVEYSKSFVEKPHPAFSGLPICPFAKQARLKNRVLYVVVELSIDTAFAEIEKWRATSKQVLILVDPRKDLDLAGFAALSEEFERRLAGSLDLTWSHPLSEYLDHGVYTRRDPYPNWQLLEVEEFCRAQMQLKNSRWYDMVT